MKWFKYLLCFFLLVWFVGEIASQMGERAGARLAQKEIDDRRKKGESKLKDVVEKMKDNQASFQSEFHAWWALNERRPAVDFMKKVMFSEDFSFRGSKFGMSPAEVMRNEELLIDTRHFPGFEISDDAIWYLYYMGEGLPGQIIYIFDSAKKLEVIVVHLASPPMPESEIESFFADIAPSFSQTMGPPQENTGSGYKWVRKGYYLYAFGFPDLKMGSELALPVSFLYSNATKFKDVSVSEERLKFEKEMKISADVLKQIN